MKKPTILPTASLCSWGSSRSGRDVDFGVAVAVTVTTTAGIDSAAEEVAVTTEVTRAVVVDACAVAVSVTTMVLVNVADEEGDIERLSTSEDMML